MRGLSVPGLMDTRTYCKYVGARVLPHSLRAFEHESKSNNVYYEVIPNNAYFKVICQIWVLQRKSVFFFPIFIGKISYGFLKIGKISYKYPK